ncbi:TPA_asm: protein ElaB, partial [Salmonella enterica subsp. enterica]|nr:protein ElaB [Salmonella enterica subsp. enterica serovar Choleraesuis]
MLTQRRMRMSYQFGESRVDDDLTLL